MLTLTRKQGQTVVINHSWRVVVTHIGPEKVRLGFDFPESMSIHRSEIEAKVGGDPIDVDDLLAELESTKARLRRLETKIGHGCTDMHCDMCDGGES